MTDRKIDKKSGKNIYIVESREFHAKSLLEIDVAKDLDYSNLPLKAAQNNNLGTVMSLPDNTNILFRDISVQNLVDKAAKEGLYEKNESEHLKNDLLISMQEGGGHFMATFSNGTHHFQTDFMPESNDPDGDQGFVSRLTHAVSSFFIARTDICKLIAPDLQKGRYTKDSGNERYSDQFIGMKKPLLGQYSITFSISDDQYNAAYEENQKMKDKCDSEELGYGPMINKEDDSVENCITSIEVIMKSIGFNDSFVNFFLDHQLLFGENVVGRYILNYKYDYEYQVATEIAQYTPSLFTLALGFASLKFISEDAKWAPYVAALSALLPEEGTSDILKSSNDDSNVFIHIPSPDPNFIVDNCIESSNDFTFVDPDHKCIFDKDGMYKNDLEGQYENALGRSYNFTFEDKNIAGIVEYTEDIRCPIEKEFAEMAGEVA